MALVEIMDVSMSPLNSEGLSGRHIDSPKPESHIEIYAINIEGWVLCQSRAIPTVEVLCQSVPLRRAGVNVQRLDVAKVYPEIPYAKNSGFRIPINVLEVPPEFELHIQAVFHDQSRVLIGTIRGRRRRLKSTFQPRFQPLMITTLGRTGSTWVTHLLGQHPEIVSYRPFKYETRAAEYWMHVLTSLTDPASYLNILGTHRSGRYWWTGERQPIANLPIDDVHIQNWLGHAAIEEAISFCQSRIEKFYEQVALSQSQLQAVYFAEKLVPSLALQFLMLELYPKAKEIILVRDFRDMVCSMHSYSRKRGYDGFGRDRVATDEEYIQDLRTSACNLLRNWKNRSHSAYLLRYEDLVLYPEETLVSLLDYLELDRGTEMVCQTLQQASDSSVKAQLNHQTSTDPKSSIGRWRREVSPLQQGLLQEAFSDLLDEFGYSTVLD